MLEASRKLVSILRRHRERRHTAFSGDTERGDTQHSPKTQREETYSTAAEVARLTNIVKEIKQKKTKQPGNSLLFAFKVQAQPGGLAKCFMSLSKINLGCEQRFHGSGSRFERHLFHQN
ncbi:hypothetical protein PoB_003823900 [Plakobranchus ocellatus]|uniref:Uncharacterized protein n=1 Tax=Plakobranchus ocellatus TaxID=259542 RepID=A0AAV4AVD3_9GAST|nr:hypothetical protein PoB_003823900 [Plakobranchus ocellatus]